MRQVLVNSMILNGKVRNLLASHKAPQGLLHAKGHHPNIQPNG